MIKFSLVCIFIIQSNDVSVSEFTNLQQYRL